MTDEERAREVALPTHYSTAAGPHCPYPDCGKLNRADEPHHYSEDWTDGECGYCLRPFTVSVNHHISWRTTAVAQHLKEMEP